MSAASGSNSRRYWEEPTDKARPMIVSPSASYCSAFIAGGRTAVKVLAEGERQKKGARVEREGEGERASNGTTHAEEGRVDQQESTKHDANVPSNNVHARQHTQQRRHTITTTQTQKMQRKKCTAKKPRHAPTSAPLADKTMERHNHKRKNSE